MGNDPDNSNIATRLEKALNQRLPENTRQRRAIHAILNRSVEYGRAARVLENNTGDEACSEYVGQVITYQKKYHNLIACLKRNDPEAWAAITAKIRSWVNQYLRKRNIYGPLRERCVSECVPNSVLAYLSSAYHYDTDFYAWFCVLVQNICRKYIKEQSHPNNRNQDNALSLDDSGTFAETPSGNNEIDSHRLGDLRKELLEAVEKLSSEARKELIMLHYFSGYSFKEIAVRMNKSLNAIYQLHFDALNDLRDNINL